MFMVSMMNMIFLHQYFLQTISLEIPCFFSSFFDNLLACLIDVTFIYAVSWIITFRRVKASLIITFVITLLCSFCNVFYARFFHQYLSWSSIGLAGNLADPIVLDSMTAGFRLIDLYYPLVIILFCWLYFRSKHHDAISRSLRTLIFTWLCCLSLCLATHFLYAFHPHCTIVYELEKTVFTPAKMDSMWPNWTFFHKGFFRKLIIDQLKRNSKLELTKEQEVAIEKEYSDHSQRVAGRTAPDNVKNIIPSPLVNCGIDSGDWNGASAQQIISKNLEKTHLKEQARPMKMAFAEALKLLGKKGESFDIIFMDPPYAMASAFAKTASELIKEYKLLNEDGIFIVESDVDTDISTIVTNMTCIKSCQYGSTLVTFFVE